MAFDMHQQRVVAQMAALHVAGPTHQVRVVSGHADTEHPALHRDRPHAPVPPNEGVLHFWPFAKYAVAFPKISRSIFTLANSARRRLISICSALTGLLSAPKSLPCRCALTELNSVCSTTPSVLAAAAILSLSCASLSASCLLEFERVARPCCLRHFRSFCLN